MRTLSRFLENPFDDPNVSIAELFAFSTDHLQRLIANNTGELSDRITATQGALDLCDSAYSDDIAQKGLRKSKKKAKDLFRESLPATMTQLALVVELKFGKNSPEVDEFFPEGRSVFGKCRDDQVDNHLHTFVTRATAYEAQLGAQFKADAEAVKTAWNTVYGNSETASGAKTTSQDAKKAARENLQLMLFLNLLKLAEMWPRQPQKLALYMQQSLLQNPQEQPQPPAPPPPSP